MEEQDGRKGTPRLTDAPNVPVNSVNPVWSIFFCLEGKCRPSVLQKCGDFPFPRLTDVATECRPLRALDRRHAF
jgi:hypothetical protein